MLKQLVLYIEHYGSDYCWCWRADDGAYSTVKSGDVVALHKDIGAGSHTALLIVGGSQVAMRELAYAEQEKKHLRRLLPYQLEDQVIGDIEQFHFALGAAQEGSVTLAYTEHSRLREIFAELTGVGIEVGQCIPASLLLPLSAANDESAENNRDAWSLHLEESQVLVRHGAQLGFCVDRNNLTTALTLLLSAQNRVDTLPQLSLSAPTEAELEVLEALLPSSLLDSQKVKRCHFIWEYAPDKNSIDLCQGEFSQRLPIERWWGIWRTVAILAFVALAVYIGILLLSVSQLKGKNLELRRDIEAAFRTVVPRGPANDPERRLKIMARDLEPAGQDSQAVALLSEVLPKVNANSAITIKSVYYTADNADLSLNIQATSFNAIESLRTEIGKVGLQAELLSSSAQGGNHSARLKITRALP